MSFNPNWCDCVYIEYMPITNIKPSKPRVLAGPFPTFDQALEWLADSDVPYSIHAYSSAQDDVRKVSTIVVTD